MSSDRHPIDKEDAHLSRFVAFGLAGACMVCLTQIVTVGALDTCLKLSVGGFAVALPALAASGLMYDQMARHSTITQRAYVLPLKTFPVGLLSGLWGLIFLFWHFHWAFGVLFVATTIGCVAIWFNFSDNADAKDKPYQYVRKI